MIPFNKPAVSGKEIHYIQEAILGQKLSGDGYFAKKCEQWFAEKSSSLKTLLTPSCTHALEMAALLLDLSEGDEVIMPSYTFVSTANAFVLRGAKVVFVDIRPDTMNIDEKLIESAITEKTKAIVPVHYAGVACEMDAIMSIAEKYGLFVIEDAAQGMMSTYKGRPLGSIGHLAAFSFHETKNYTSGGEGGLLLINDDRFIKRAEILREKGTNRSQFFRGAVDKYTWVDLGSSMLPSEIQAAYLWAQLESAEDINHKRLEIWRGYYNSFNALRSQGNVSLPLVPEQCAHNAHMFYLKLSSLEERERFIEYLKANDVMAVFHYVPLHSSPAGEKFGHFHGSDNYTTSESERLVRLPLYYSMTEQEQRQVIETVFSYFIKS
ncbi:MULTISPECIES: dTDP-4-amino-4,6-dideoxygalactose transaminase [Vibrio]|uniref:dTDP-4-amino-4,6-dideoxygalactose transaminase n=1 Tax=Vibrio TaxID=662 RepID=UPI00023763A2|nr:MULTISPECIES: dTDP-4-amino-4,6-dideoxygalactose transaminase [Vibrio]MDK9775064.1 dTDP-4-amino-4,6-dideoxygalactose transaminase [Vibrio sp. D401a]MDK9807730.1 dTDP-4-amino-4,6-dideoxygalactose transaminase [Vibrio sp. D406a]USD50173.1 dTDP-4-amino-4,6-dideoxygalactose transaminase [Vibrio sp. SCSIO 43153]